MAGPELRNKFFSWVHYFDPHLPYKPPSPFKEEFADRPYDGEVAFVDYYLGKMIDKLREKNILNKTLIICIGDHGEALGEKNEVDHGLFLYDVTLRVPLIFYAEKHIPKGLVVPSRVRVIDVLPTILDILKIAPGPQTQGESLVPQLTGKRRQSLPTYIETFMPREYYGWSELVGRSMANTSISRPRSLSSITLPKTGRERESFQKEAKVSAGMKTNSRRYRSIFFQDGPRRKKTEPRGAGEALRSRVCRRPGLGEFLR